MGCDALPPQFPTPFLSLLTACVTLAGSANADAPCQSKELGRGTVGTVIDGRSFALTDNLDGRVRAR